MQDAKDAMNNAIAMGVMTGYLVALAAAVIIFFGQ